MSDFASLQKNAVSEHPRFDNAVKTASGSGLHSLTSRQTALDVPVSGIDALLAGQPMTADMAERLAQDFATTPQFWTNLQAAFSADASKLKGGG